MAPPEPRRRPIPVKEKATSSDVQSFLHKRRNRIRQQVMNRKAKVYRQYKKVLAEDADAVAVPERTKRLLEEAERTASDDAESAHGSAAEVSGGSGTERSKTEQKRKSLQQLFEEERQKREAERAAREEAIRNAKKERYRRKKERFAEKLFLRKRTEKGQPYLNNQVLHLLKKLQSETS